jgi:hypothetical protein
MLAQVFPSQEKFLDVITSAPPAAAKYHWTDKKSWAERAASVSWHERNRSVQFWRLQAGSVVFTSRAHISLNAEIKFRKSTILTATFVLRLQEFLQSFNESWSALTTC